MDSNVPLMSTAMADTNALSKSVIDRAEDLGIEREDWQKAVYLNGLLALGDSRSTATARRWSDRAVRTQTSAGELAYGSMDRGFLVRSAGPGPRPDWWARLKDERFQSQTNTAALGVAVLEAYAATRDERYLDAVRREFERLLAGRRTSDGTICQYAGAPYVFVDAIYMICPFLVQAGIALSDARGAEEAVRQLELHTRHLLDPGRRLYRHVWCERPDHYPQSAFWSRGNGWVVAAAAQIAGTRGVADDVRDAFIDAARGLAEVLMPLQDASGFWHNTLDDPRSWLETSGTALLVYGFGSGVVQGWLPESYRPQLARAVGALRGAVDGDGSVLGVAGVPGGPDVLPEVNLTGQGTWLLGLSVEPTIGTA